MGTHNEIIRILKKMFSMCVDDVLGMRITRVSSEYQSVMTHIYWLPWFVLGNDFIIFIAILSKSSDAERAETVVCGGIDFRFARSSCIGDGCVDIVAHMRPAIG